MSSLAINASETATYRPEPRLVGAGGVSPPVRRIARRCHMMSLDPITLAFGAFNVMRLASYLPQIVAVARDRHGATAISFSCWSMWIGANASTALYAWAKLGDRNLALISSFNAVCCAAVLLLAFYKRFPVRQRKSGLARPGCM